MSKKVIIEAPSGWRRVRLGELWQYRELLWMLAYRDFRVKYAQTFLGVSWAILNPVITTFLLTFVFQRVAKMDTGDIPYPVYTLAGLVGWTYFSEVFSTAGDSILGAQHMVKKIYFPRLIIPLSKGFTALIDLCITLVLLILLMAWYQMLPGPSFLFFPLFLFFALLSGLAGGIWISALTVRYRDFRFIAPLLLRIGLFVTPIAYPASAVPEAYRFWYYLNPMAGVVEGIRWSLLGGTPPPLIAAMGFVTITVLFIGGAVYFSKVEDVIADVI